MDMIYGVRPATCSGPPPTSAGWWGTATSSTRRCSPAAPRIMYEGKPVGTPDAGAFWRVCAQHGVKVLFTAPTAMRAIKKQDPEGKLAAQHDLSKLEALYLAGERCDPPTAVWAAERCGKPVVDHWWQTETGWAITARVPRPTACSRSSPAPAARRRRATTWRRWTRTGRSAPRARSATSPLRLPLPPGRAPTLWQAEERFRERLPPRLPRLLRHLRRRMVDEEGVRLGDGPHGRHHQRRRPPPLDRRDGGGAGQPPGRRRMRRDRREGRAQGPGADRAWWC